MDTHPIAASSLEKYYYINGKQLERQYKEHLSDYSKWKESAEGLTAEKYLIFPENLGPNLSIDETSLSDGELYTIVTNKDARCRKGALVAIVFGTKSEDVYNALRLMPLEARKKVTEVTLDLSASMRRIVLFSFPNATLVIDRFHVQKLALDALQEIRIKLRWSAIEAENKLRMDARMAKQQGETNLERYEPEVLDNGDTHKQLLARSRYLLFKSRDKWTESQKVRARILFKYYPDLETAYNLTDELRRIYSMTKDKNTIRPKLALWYNHVEESKMESFKTIVETFFAHYEHILNFFNKRSTNASAECFNAKIKNFRAQLRGIVDVKYFLFRLKNIYA